MWYLWVLAGYYLIFLRWQPLTKMAIESPRIILAVLFVAAVLQRLSGNVIEWRLCFSSFFHCAFYFVFGMMLCFYSQKWEKGVLWCLLLPIAIHYISYIGLYDKAIENTSLIKALSNEIVAILVVILMFMVAYQCWNRNGFLAAIGRASLVIYLFLYCDCYEGCGDKIGSVRKYNYGYWRSCCEHCYSDNPMLLC